MFKLKPLGVILSDFFIKLVKSFIDIFIGTMLSVTIILLPKATPMIMRGFYNYMYCFVQLFCELIIWFGHNTGLIIGALIGGVINRGKSPTISPLEEPAEIPKEEKVFYAETASIEPASQRKTGTGR